MEFFPQNSSSSTFHLAKLLFSRQQALCMPHPLALAECLIARTARTAYPHHRWQSSHIRFGTSTEPTEVGKSKPITAIPTQPASSKNVSMNTATISTAVSGCFTRRAMTARFIVP